MTKVLWHVTMSLDGFIAGPDGTIDWAFGHGPPGPIGQEVIARTGAVLAGRRGYDLGTRVSTGGGAIYGGAWSGPVFVLTHRDAPTQADPQVTFLSAEIGDALGTVRAAAQGRDVGVFGADIARQSLQADLLDEIVVHLVPVLLGDGLRLFEAAGGAPVKLEKLPTVPNPGQVTDLHFSVVRADGGRAPTG